MPLSATRRAGTNFPSARPEAHSRPARGRQPPVIRSAGVSDNHLPAGPLSSPRASDQAGGAHRPWSAWPGSEPAGDPPPAVVPGPAGAARSWPGSTGGGVATCAFWSCVRKEDLPTPPLRCRRATSRLPSRYRCSHRPCRPGSRSAWRPPGKVVSRPRVRCRSHGGATAGNRAWNRLQQARAGIAPSLIQGTVPGRAGRDTLYWSANSGTSG